MREGRRKGVEGGIESDGGGRRGEWEKVKREVRKREEGDGGIERKSNEFRPARNQANTHLSIIVMVAFLFSP